MHISTHAYTRTRIHKHLKHSTDVPRSHVFGQLGESVCKCNIVMNSNFTISVELFPFRTCRNECELKY